MASALDSLLARAKGAGPKTSLENVLADIAARQNYFNTLPDEERDAERRRLQKVLNQWGKVVARNADERTNEGVLYTDRIKGVQAELDALDGKFPTPADLEGPQQSVGPSRPLETLLAAPPPAAPPAAQAALAAETTAAAQATDALRAEAATQTGAASTKIVTPVAGPRAQTLLDVPSVPVGTPLTPEIATALTSFVNESLLAAPTVSAAPGGIDTLFSAGAATTGPLKPKVNSPPKVLRTGIQETLLTGLTPLQQYAGRGVRRTLLGVG